MEVEFHFLIFPEFLGILRKISFSNLIDNFSTWIQLEGPNQDAYVYGEGASSIAFVSNIDAASEFSVKFRGNSYLLPPWSTSLIDGQGHVIYCTATLPEIGIPKSWEAVPSFSATE